MEQTQGATGDNSAPGSKVEKKPRRLQVLLIRLAIVSFFLGLPCVWMYAAMIWMPGSSFKGPLPALTPEQAALAQALRRDVEELAGKIGIRNTANHPKLEAAADFVERRFREAGYTVARQTFQADGKPCHNLEVEIPGSTMPKEIVVIGAHYDSVADCPGANDNGSGTAALLALATVFSKEKPERTLRFVAFTNEEPEFSFTPLMGSWVYAKRCHERREDVVAMVSLETIGYYSDVPKSQAYPAPLSWFYPSTGNFIAFVGNLGSRSLVRQSIGIFRRDASFPSEGAALPESLDGVGWSDHWSFWQEGYPAIMVTDTAVFRYPQYHTPEDTPDRIDYERFARVVEGMKPVVRTLTRKPAE